MSTAEFSQLVTKFSYSLKPFALSLTRDMEDAKDLLQETVYRALSSQDKYTEGTNLKAWLYTIMKNIFINNYRRKIKRNTIIDSTEDQFYINSSDSTVTLNRGESNMVMVDITTEIDRLTEDYRTPFLMHYQGFKYHEIADHLTLPIGTVKSRIHFARKELKRKLRVN
jgi:RNA polymerase sigma factor (sigma-70 family)